MSPRRRSARPWLLPFVPFYAMAANARSARFDANPRLAARLAAPVISVGSLSAGGAGKTPFLIALANLFTAHGIALDVLSRGYGRRSRAVARVDPEGSADDFGDEPLLIARATGCTVYVGADRHAAGLLAERVGPPRLHLLDDGLQHRRLARQVDIALLTREDVDDFLLPAGNLREGLEALLRAQILVVRADEAVSLRHHLLDYFGVEPHLWTVDRSLRLQQMPMRPLAFCGIARPGSFLSMLAQSGIAPEAKIAFRDHHRYTHRDITRLVAKAERCGAHSFVTTAKDAVKLSPEMLSTLASVGPLVVAELQTALHQPERCLAEIECLLPKIWRRS